MKHFLIGTLVSLILNVTAFAGGTLSFDEIKPLINQQPEVAKFLFSTLDFDDTAYAEAIVGNEINKKLGGTRIGPYYVNAKPKGSKGPFIFQIVIQTDPVFTDIRGRKLDDDHIGQAVKVSETLTHIEISKTESQT